MSKKILLMGPPAAGKGTQAEMIINKYQIRYISTGSIFRQEIRNKTDIGIQAESYILNGQLVPDEIAYKIAMIFLNDDLLERGFLFDGFPRTVGQSKFLDDYLKNNSTKLNAMLFIEIPFQVIFDRITKRRSCINCNAVYNLSTKPPKIEGHCDICHQKLIQRDDDRENIVKTRLVAYDSFTKPLKDYYHQRDGFHLLDGLKPSEEIFSDICSFLGDSM